MVPVREATSQDLQRLAQAITAMPLFERYGTSPQGLLRDLEAGLARGEGILVAGEVEPVGLAWYIPGGAFVRGAYLRLIAVLPRAQSRGVGRALLDEVERRAARTNGSLFLLVSDFNGDAQRFYEACGYRHAGR